MYKEEEKQEKDENIEKPVKVKIRLDFKGTSRAGRHIFGGKSQEKNAEDTREQQVAMFRNIPMQGIYIENIDTSGDVFSVYDELAHREIAYAPVVLTISADTLEDVIPFITREEFRKIQIIKPQDLYLTRYEGERLFFNMHQQMQRELNNIRRKYMK
ncbi:MAG: hypothetical protein K9L17_00900 [Clostridiales bacterium]|nr:hypothetical protein [Clostridiales bacterium]MCF8021250.1 hypothetical protein [Clostridiales bacterium]